MLLLPAAPMMPRLHDARVGFINTSLLDYGRPEHEAVTRRYIHRFRLEKKDPNVAVSDPVKPIEFWIDPATPSWLVPWVRAGVEAWLPAFEEAGFRNAIAARMPPARQEEPSWSMHDARHSMIYWRPSTIANATGGQTVDPRSGEIIKAEVNMFHNIMQLMRDWYFIQASPVDARARSLPFPDSLMGRLVQNVVTHEVGHAIGFPHNMKSSSMYPADSVRSASFIRRMGGHSASVMDYSRFNYVAQPEDKIPLEHIIPNVGPYDRFAVLWGHKPIPGARTPDEEKETLDRWARAQDTVPWYRFSTTGATNDPGDLTEAVGDADAVKSTTYALKNLERVMGWLIPTAEKPGQDYSVLTSLYGEAVSQWSRYMGHVAAVVAAAESQERFGTGARFEPLARERQREAVAFLSRNAFRVPKYFTNPDVLRRIESEGVVARIRGAQSSVLNSLLGERRLNRLIEYEALARHSRDAYTVADLLSDVRVGVWGELLAPSVRIDVYRRNLQRAYLETVERQISPSRAAAAPGPIIIFEIPSVLSVPASSSDARPILRGELLELRRAADSAIAHAADNITRLHLRDVVFQIDRMLDPKE
ncbi:MAG: zinc-dependent metalloprotease, partial [Longimicrobiales bacterium]